MKPIFFIDYDNTIFSHQTWQIPESALCALEQLKKEGYKVVIASGRLFRSNALPVEIQGRFVPDCLVSANGAVIEIEGELVKEKYFDQDLQKRILDYVVEKNYCLMYGADEDWCTSSIERFMEVASPKQQQMLPKSGDAFRALYQKEIPSFFLADTKEAIDDVQEHFPETKLLYMGDNLGGADLIPKENGKVMGAARILEHYHADWKDIVAIGDSMNDIELIQTAGYGIAMGNAMPEVQKAADYVAKDIDEAGLADAIAMAKMKYSEEGRIFRKLTQYRVQ